MDTQDKPDRADGPCFSGGGPFAGADEGLGPAATPARRISADDEAVARACNALGHPARVAIMRHLLGAGRCVCGRIVQIMPLAQSTVSRHLKVLKQAGLVRGEVEGPRTCYCVDNGNLAALRAALADLCGSGEDE